MSSDKNRSFKPAGWEDEDDEFDLCSSFTSSTGGRIRIVKGLGYKARLDKQDFDVTLPPDASEWLNNFTKTFNTYKKGVIVSRGIRMFLETRNDLYEIVLKLYANLPGSSNPKSGTLAYALIKEFHAYLTSFDNETIGKMKQFISDDLKMVAFNFFYNQSQLFTIICDCYDLQSSRNIFFERIRELITEQKYKDACQSACELQLYEGFSIDEFLIPLILQDKISVAEKYLANAVSLQTKLVSFLDSWLDHRRSLPSFYDSYLGKVDISGINYSKLQRKTLKKLVKRYAEMYNIPKEMTPFLREMDDYGMLQLMLNKKYVDKTLKDWDEYIKETVLSSSGRLIDELITACCDYNDIPEAAKWLKYFQADPYNYPIVLQEFINEDSDSNGKHSKYHYANVLEEPPAIVEYSIDYKKIDLISTIENFHRMIGELIHFNTVGFDCEWKFGECEIDLIQLACKLRVYLIDVKVLKGILGHDDWKELGRKIFRNDEILKIGFSQASDIAMLKKTLPDLYLNYEKFTSIDLQKLWRYLGECTGFKLPYQKNSFGRAKQDLRQLTSLCLGVQLSKDQQFSNWSKRPLTREQIIYAASDAHCLLEIFDVMKQEAARLKIDLNDYDLCKKLK